MNLENKKLAEKHSSKVLNNKIGSKYDEDSRSFHINFQKKCY